MSRAGSTAHSVHKSTTSDSDAAASLQGGVHLSQDTAEKTPSPRTGNVREEEITDTDVLWLDWDGPTDPMNPQK